MDFIEVWNLDAPSGRYHYAHRRDSWNVDAALAAVDFSQPIIRVRAFKSRRLRKGWTIQFLSGKEAPEQGYDVSLSFFQCSQCQRVYPERHAADCPKVTK